jgi:putative DNA primase/helicase
MTRPIDALLRRLKGGRRSGGGYLAHCPAHADRHRSLSIGSNARGDALIHCFAGCSPASILAALGLSWRDLFKPDFGRHRRRCHRRVSQKGEPR